MKARIVEFKHDYTLSIGMIVKNEEKWLEKCLTALKPLMEAVSSELIIVDTGSTDKTVEIAEKFTDKVYFFEWINDFAAARNFGLDKAKGEWFMFIDADEILDKDISEMVDFFNNPEKSSQYNTCFYAIRNFTIHGKAAYVVINSQRIARRTPELRFLGEIHEYFNSVNPIHYFNTFVEHWGYNYSTTEEDKAKSKRNLEILYKQLEETPQDNYDNRVKLFCEIIDSFRGDEEKRDEYIVKAIEAAKKVNVPLAYVRPYHVAMSHYMIDRPNDTIKYADEYISVAKGNEAHIVDAYAFKTIALFHAKKYNKIKETADKYREFYTKYYNNELDKSSTQICGIAFTDDGKYRFINELTGIGLAEGRQFNEAFEYIDKSDRPNQPEVIFLAMKHGIDLSERIKNYKHEQIDSSLNEAAMTFQDFQKVVFDYIKPDLFTGSIKQLLFAVTALEFAVLRAESDAEEHKLGYDEKLELYNRFITMVSVYVSNIYNADLLADDSDIGVLPPLHRFGYYCAVALQALESGDGLTYIRTLRRAIDENIGMKEVVEFLLKDFAKNL